MQHLSKLKGSSENSFMESRAKKKADQKASNLPFHKRKAKRAKLTYATGILINILSASSAAFGAYTLLGTDATQSIILAAVIILLLIGLEVYYRECSDDYWDDYQLFAIIWSKKLPIFLLLALINISISCAGIYKAYKTFADPDPHYVALKAELSTNEAEIKSIKRENEAAKKDPTKRVDGKMSNPIYYEETKNISKRDKTKDLLVLRNAELRKEINASDIPMTKEYALEVVTNGIVLIFVFVGLGIFYQMLMCFNSKFDASFILHEDPVKYISLAKKKYPTATKEEFYDFVNDYLNQYPTAKKIYNKENSKKSFKADTVF